MISLLELSRADEANTRTRCRAHSRTTQSAVTRRHRLLVRRAGATTTRLSTSHASDVAVESRYTWAQIALAHAYLGSKHPLDAERAMRYARKYGKFPTLNYELANVSRRWVFTRKQWKCCASRSRSKTTDPHQPRRTPAANEAGFIEPAGARTPRRNLTSLAPVDTPENAKLMKALLAFNAAHACEGKGERNRRRRAAQEFASGTDNMRGFRQFYAASRLLRNGIASRTVLERSPQREKLQTTRSTRR